jgi:hypothetical protein
VIRLALWKFTSKLSCMLLCERPPETRFRRQWYLSDIRGGFAANPSLVRCHGRNEKGGFGTLI